MIIFIDDSGDPGFKFDKGSTPFFVIAMVIFDDELEAEKTAVAIKDLRRALRWHDQQEFRFFKNAKHIREQFLQTVTKSHFRIRAIVVEKQRIRSTELRTKKASFYAYFVKELIKHNGGTITNAKVRIDGSGDRLFRRKFQTYLRRELNSTSGIVMKDCKLVNSKTNVLVQMADMIAGSINRSYNAQKPDAMLYKGIIKRHIEDEWRFS